MVDESHSAGVVGATGHGVSELYKTHGRVDIYTGTTFVRQASSSSCSPLMRWLALLI